MSADDLDRPLGYIARPDASAAPVRRDRSWLVLALAAVICVIAASLVIFVFATDRTLRSSQIPVAQAPVAVPADAVPPRRIAVPAATAPVSSESDTTVASGGVRIISPSPDQDNGVKVIRRNSGEGSGSEALIIRVPQDMRPEGRSSVQPSAAAPTAASASAPAPATASVPDARLVISGPYGPLPRIGRDGARPIDVYARPLPVTSVLPPAAPRLALVVTGLGGDVQASMQAAKALPAAVTLAFSSSAMRLEEQTEQARLAGHELLLQVPMEGYAGEDSGMRALMLNGTRDKNLDALYWHMSRFPGYIGLTHAQGGRFMASASAFSPVLQDVAERGLLFFDDGTARQAMTSAVAMATGAPALRADVTLDPGTRADAQEAALQRLETLARDKGAAIGVVRLNPSAIDRLARFAQGLEAQGIALVPLSAFASAPTRNVAR